MPMDRVLGVASAYVSESQRSLGTSGRWPAEKKAKIPERMPVPFENMLCPAVAELFQSATNILPSALPLVHLPSSVGAQHVVLAGFRKMQIPPYAFGCGSE